MSKRPARGVTLIELMVTVSIAAIMMTLAAPSFRDFVRSNQLRTSVSDLSTLLLLARSESIRRGWPVTLCKSADITAAAPACSQAVGWNQGWLLFVDHNQNGSLDTTASASFPADIALRVGAPASSDIAIAGGTNFAQHVSFLSSGFPRGSGGADGGSFTFCLSPQGRTLDVSKTGRSQITSGSCP